MIAPTHSAPAIADAPAEIVRFAALGDSVTEGVGAPAGPATPGWRGWPALLAPALAADPAHVLHRNLAVSGARSADLVSRQLPAALAMRPHLVAVVAGGNDTLRADFDIARTAADLDTALRELAAAGSVLLTACLPDPGRLLGLPGPLARPLARRMAAVNTVVHELSRRHDAIHLHLAELPWLRDRPLLSADRLHPSPAGHLLIAREFHACLAAAGHPVGPPPAAVLAPPAPAAAPTCGGWPPGEQRGWRGAASTCCPACWPWRPPKPCSNSAVGAPSWTPAPKRRPGRRWRRSGRQAAGGWSDQEAGQLWSKWVHPSTISVADLAVNN